MKSEEYSCIISQILGFCSACVIGSALFSESDKQIPAPDKSCLQVFVRLVSANRRPLVSYLKKPFINHWVWIVFMSFLRRQRLYSAHSEDESSLGLTSSSRPTASRSFQPFSRGLIRSSIVLVEIFSIYF